MRTTIDERAQRLTFPEGWVVMKYDSNKGYYKKHFQGVAPGTKAVDVIAIDLSSAETWLIEIKDYRLAPRSKDKQARDGSIVDEVVLKVRDSLGGLLAMAMNDNHEEQATARQALASKRLRVSLQHSPWRGNRGYQRVQDILANQKASLKQRLKGVTTKIIVTDGSVNAPWTVTQLAKNQQEADL